MNYLSVFVKIAILSAFICSIGLTTGSLAEGLIQCASPKISQKSAELQARLQSIIDSSENIPELDTRLKMEGELGRILVDYGAYIQKFVRDSRPVKLSGRKWEKVLNFHIVNMFILGGKNNLSSDFIYSHKQFLSVNSKYCIFSHENFMVNLVGSLFNTNREYLLIRKERKKRFQAIVKNYRYLAKYRLLLGKKNIQTPYLNNYIRILGSVDNAVLREEIDYWQKFRGDEIFDKASEDSSMRDFLNIPKNRIVSTQEKKEYREKFDRQNFFGRTFGNLTKKYVFDTLETKISAIQARSEIDLAEVMLCKIYLVHNQELLQFRVCEE